MLVATSIICMCCRTSVPGGDDHTANMPSSRESARGAKNDRKNRYHQRTAVRVAGARASIKTGWRPRTGTLEENC